MNNLPTVVPPWISLKCLIETRMGEILRKEHDNKKYVRLYNVGEYWHAFEKSAFLLDQLFKNKKIILFNHKDYPFPIVMVCISDNDLQNYIRQHILVRNKPGYKELLAWELSAVEYYSWHKRTVKKFL